MRISIIDDEEFIRDSLRWYLEDLGHEVMVASEPMYCDVYDGCICGKMDSKIQTQK